MEEGNFSKQGQVITVIRVLVLFQILHDTTVKQIIESGDISLNPGPVKCPCCICGKAVAKTHTQSNTMRLLRQMVPHWIEMWKSEAC